MPKIENLLKNKNLEDFYARRNTQNRRDVEVYC